MPQAEIEELKRMSQRLEEEKIKLKKYLDELTTDGKGHLFDLKQVVGADTELGYAISKLGGSVMSASSKAIKSFEELNEMLKNNISSTEILQEEASSSYTSLSQQFADIDFN